MNATFFIRSVRATIVFKDNVDDLSRRDIKENESHWKVGGEVGLEPKVEATGLTLGGAKITGEYGENSKTNRTRDKKYKKGDTGATSELAFEAGVPSFGNISCKVYWKKNDLNLNFEKRYDGDCQFHINITK